MIVTGGENVWPAAGRGCSAHPPTRWPTSAVAGRPDPEWGQRVVAWVVPGAATDPPTLAELRAVVAERVAPYAAPRQLVVVGSLPRTSLGKVEKGRLHAAPGRPSE